MPIHDLVLAKLSAGRDRDREFARICIEHGLCGVEVLLERCATNQRGASQPLS